MTGLDKIRQMLEELDEQISVSAKEIHLRSEAHRTMLRKREQLKTEAWQLAHESELQEILAMEVKIGDWINGHYVVAIEIKVSRASTQYRFYTHRGEQLIIGTTSNHHLRVLRREPGNPA